MSENYEPNETLPSELSPQARVERELVFDIRFLEDMTFWVETNRKTALRVLSLIE